MTTSPSSAWPAGFLRLRTPPPLASPQYGRQRDRRGPTGSLAGRAPARPARARPRTARRIPRRGRRVRRRRSSGSRRARPSAMDPQQRLLLEVGPGRRWNAPGSTRRRCAARGPACSLGASLVELRHLLLHRAPDGPAGHLLTGTHRQRHLRPRLLHARARGPGGDGRHGRSSLAGRAAPGLPGAAPRRVRDGARRRRHGDGHPGPVRAFCAQRGLAADGRCKPFSADADGIGWPRAPGCVVAGAAVGRAAQRPPVLAVIRGSAINQDGGRTA